MKQIRSFWEKVVKFAVKVNQALCKHPVVVPYREDIDGKTVITYDCDHCKKYLGNKLW